MTFKQTTDKALEQFKDKTMSHELVLEVYQEICRVFEEMHNKKIQIDRGYTNKAIMRTLCG